MRLWRRLKNLRENRGQSTVNLAAALDISTAHLSNLENDKRLPSLDLLVALANYYQTTTDYLLGITDDPRQPQAKQGREGHPEGSRLGPGCWAPSDAHIPEELAKSFTILSERTKTLVITLVQVMAEHDERWRAYERAANAIEATYGKDFLDVLGQHLAARATDLGDMSLAIAETQALLLAEEAAEKQSK